MLELDLAPALEGVGITILSVAERVPVTQGRLHAKLPLERPQRRVCVERPVTPSGAGEAVLEHHAHDCHHRQAAVCQL